MGRGRAKAKQTKVARDLKYRSYSTDFASLERELRGESGDAYDEDPEEFDPYAELADRYADPEPAHDEEDYDRQAG
ncbi:MAG: DUF3073 domain-containing protein [Propionibacteriaceae bacterium]|jgi:hypothetical protein|nr:DUF3073 domain-containing protein [Propionibacteriaceae bacterium]